MDNIIPVPLDLPDIRILSAEKTRERAWLVRIESTLESTACSRCGQQISDFHGLDDPIRLRHLPIFDVPVFLELRPKRFRCPDCPGGPTTTQRCAWYRPRSRSTTAFEHWALRCLIDSTIAETARKLSTTEEMLEGILDRHLKLKVDWRRYRSITTIGIDEIALRKGRRDFVVLVTTLVEGRVEVLAVLEDRRKATLVRFLSSIPKGVRRRIEQVCIDMYVGYERAVKEQLPGARVIVDRFHVARAYGAAADAVRKRERRRLDKELSEAAYAEIAGAMWPFRRRCEDLDDKDWHLLDRIFGHSSEMKTAYDLREDLRELFDRPYSKRGAKVAIRAWCKRVRASGLKEFDAFLGTIETWLDEITNYFEDRQTSGFVEGFNNRVKVLKRRAYGIFDLGRLFQRLTLDVRGHALFAPT
jgi:transposase